jgi:hypothetical protein
MYWMEFVGVEVGTERGLRPLPRSWEGWHGLGAEALDVSNYRAAVVRLCAAGIAAAAHSLSASLLAARQSLPICHPELGRHFRSAYRLQACAGCSRLVVQVKHVHDLRQ